jgi:mRNA interferase MazF
MQWGEIWWADLPTPVASEPGYRRSTPYTQKWSFHYESERTLTLVLVFIKLLLSGTDISSSSNDLRNDVRLQHPSRLLTHQLHWHLCIFGSS